jgi:hypothetical protein
MAAVAAVVVGAFGLGAGALNALVPPGSPMYNLRLVLDQARGAFVLGHPNPGQYALSYQFPAVQLPAAGGVTRTANGTIGGLPTTLTLTATEACGTGGPCGRFVVSLAGLSTPASAKFGELKGTFACAPDRCTLAMAQATGVFAQVNSPRVSVSAARVSEGRLMVKMASRGDWVAAVAMAAYALQTDGMLPVGLTVQDLVGKAAANDQKSRNGGGPNGRVEESAPNSAGAQSGGKGAGSGTGTSESGNTGTAGSTSNGSAAGGVSLGGGAGPNGVGGGINGNGSAPTNDRATVGGGATVNNASTGTSGVGVSGGASVDAGASTGTGGAGVSGGASVDAGASTGTGGAGVSGGASVDAGASTGSSGAGVGGGANVNAGGSGGSSGVNAGGGAGVNAGAGGIGVGGGVNVNGGVNAPGGLGGPGGSGNGGGGSGGGGSGGSGGRDANTGRER